VDRLYHFIHRYFIWPLLGSYAVAALWPGPGLAARAVSFGQVTILGETVRLTPPVLMLAFLLLNAGLGVQTGQLKNLLRHPLALMAGLAANLLVPIAYIFLVSRTMRVWHNPDEVQNILVGLALVASMPIAGSSTAWSQNANGNLALSLGLVLFSTLLSPLTTPVALHSVGWMAAGDYAEDLHELASGGTGGFLAVTVLVPSLLGMVTRAAVGDARISPAKPVLKLLNVIVLLLLNYANALVSLPQVVADPDWDFLTVVVLIVMALCVASFAAGLLIARWVRADAPQRASLAFGLGMTNNGTGLVLASMALADHPRVLLPIILYNLVQHLVASCVDILLRRTGPRRRVDVSPEGGRSRPLAAGAALPEDCMRRDERETKERETQ
jgi:BASS family bile acid:Na+ symporter